MKNLDEMREKISASPKKFVKNKIQEQKESLEPEAVKKARLVAQNAKRVAFHVKNTVKNALLFVKGFISSILFLVASPFGWLIMGMIIASIALIVLTTTIGQNSFDSDCLNIDEKNKKECVVFGDGSGKGRTSGQGSSDGSGGGLMLEAASFGSGSMSQRFHYDQLPEKWKSKVKPIITSRMSNNGYPRGQCTWYVKERAKEYGQNFYDYLGNGGDWARSAAARGGYTISKKPVGRSAICFPRGVAGGDPTYGHIAWCEGVAADGSILVSDSNYNWQGERSAAFYVLPASVASQLTYITATPGG